MAYEGNQFSYYQNIQLDADGALIVSVDGFTGGTSGSSLGTDFGFELNKDLYYTLGIIPDGSNISILSNTVRVIPFVPQQTLTINQLSVYCMKTGTTQFKIVCYNSVNGLPNTLLFQSPIISATTIGNYVYNTTYTFNAGTTYWIGVYGNNNSSGFQYIARATAKPIGQGTTTSTNYTHISGSSTFPNDISTFPTPIYETGSNIINVRFKFN
jgi:hypothetical protein